MFKAHIEKRWETDEVSIYLVERSHISSGQTYFKATESGVVGTTVSAGAAILEPLMRLPLEAVEALALALSSSLPPSQAVSLHLKDATEVRDRVLSLLEQVVNRGQ